MLLYKVQQPLFKVIKYIFNTINIYRNKLLFYYIHVNMSILNFLYSSIIAALNPFNCFLEILSYIVFLFPINLLIMDKIFLVGLISGATDINSNSIHLQPLRHFSTCSQWSALQNMKEHSLIITPLFYNVISLFRLNLFCDPGQCLYRKQSYLYIIRWNKYRIYIYIIINIYLQHDGRCKRRIIQSHNTKQGIVNIFNQILNSCYFYHNFITKV